MSPPILTIVLHTLNILIGILSITILALVARSVILTDAIGDAYPEDVKGTGRGFLFWPGVGGIVDMLLFAFLWFRGSVCSTKKRTAYWNGLLFVASFIFGRPFITLIYTWVEWNQASKNQISPARGYNTTESWACAAANGDGVRDARSVCTQLHAVRYILIPEVVLGAMMLALVIRMRIRVSKEEKSVLRAEPQVKV